MENMTIQSEIVNTNAFHIIQISGYSYNKNTISMHRTNIRPPIQKPVSCPSG